MTTTAFSPLSLGSLTLKNRFVRSATWDGMADAQGRPTPPQLALYRQLAAAELGLIITGYIAVHPLGLQFPGTLRLDSDALVSALAPLPATVHAAGGKLVAQLFHGGGQTGPKALGRPGLAPAAISFPSFDGVPEAMTEAQIGETLAAFGQAARRARAAGFDGVQLHAAHGYLIHQFLSPLTNPRRDGWGGSPAGRRRFLLEACAAVRREAGADFPLLVKLNGCDNLDGGMTLADATEVARALEQAGVCALEISAGSPASGKESPVRAGIRAGENEGFNADLARAIRQAVTIPVITVGGLRSRATIDRLLAEGGTDAVALSRPLIRQPELILSWHAGATDAASCISCNGCFRPGLKAGGIRCILDHPLT